MKFRASPGRSAIAGLALSSLALGSAAAAPLLVIDARSGEVLVEHDAARPWYPASLTKLVTVYAALKAVRQGRITLDTPLVVSVRASRMPASKMGFRPGQEVTLDNALKMLMVKSANDLAVTIAEGVGGSVESFAGEMNKVAAELGMRESHFVNPNGLHNPAHVSSARDMATIGRALYRDFPDHSDLYGIGALQFGGRIIPTHNGIMGRYPGAEGMKTGFVCASGFNVVASATRGGRRLIAVVMGYPNAKSRTIKAASLFDEGFSAASTGMQVSALPAIGGGAPDVRAEVCGRNRRTVSEDDFAVPVAGYTAPASQAENDSPAFFFANDGRPPQGSTSRAASITAEQMAVRPWFDPVPVYVGRAPGWTGPVAAARDSASATARSKPVTATAYAAKTSERNGPLAADPEAVPMKRSGAKAKEQKPVTTASRESDGHKAKTAAKTKPDPKAKKTAEAKPAIGKKPKSQEP